MIARKRSAIKNRTDKIAVTPHQPASAYRAEIVGRDTKLGWHDVEAIQANANAAVGDVAHTTRVYAGETRSKHHCAAVDNCSFSRAALEQIIPRRDC